MGDRCLYLHVGTHKTGTRSIQDFLGAQTADLKIRGLSVMTQAGTSNLFGLAHAALRNDVQTPMRLKQGGLRGLTPDNRALQRFKAAAAQDPAPIHLVSSESFCFLRTDAERAFLLEHLQPLYNEIRPILVLRNIPDWKRSWDGQIRKAGLTETVASLPDAARVTAQWYYDHDALMSFWAGVGCLHVIRYDDAMAQDGSILPAFLTAIHCQDVTLTQTYFANRSVDAFENLATSGGSAVPQKLAPSMHKGMTQ